MLHNHKLYLNVAVNIFVETTTLETLVENLDDIESIVIQFSIDANFTAVIGDNITAAKAEVRTWLATTMNVNEDWIVDLELTPGLNSMHQPWHYTGKDRSFPLLLNVM